MWQAPFTHWAILLAPLVVALTVRALHALWMLASSEGCAVKPGRPAPPTLQREVWMVSKCCMETTAYLGVEIKKEMWFGGVGERVADAWWSWDPVNGICELCPCPLSFCGYVRLRCAFCLHFFLWVMTSVFKPFCLWKHVLFRDLRSGTTVISPKEAGLYPFHLRAVK